MSESTDTQMLMKPMGLCQLQLQESRSDETLQLGKKYLVDGWPRVHDTEVRIIFKIHHGLAL